MTIVNVNDPSSELLSDYVFKHRFAGLVSAVISDDIVSREGVSSHRPVMSAILRYRGQTRLIVKKTIFTRTTRNQLLFKLVKLKKKQCGGVYFCLHASHIDCRFNKNSLLRSFTFQRCYWLDWNIFFSFCNYQNGIQIENYIMRLIFKVEIES